MLATAIFIKNIFGIFFTSDISKRVVLIAFSLLLNALVVKHGFEILRNASRENAEKTRKFTGIIATLTEKLGADPSSDLLFISASAFDYEPIASSGIF